MKDVYQEITNKIVAALENGVNPWRCSWNNEGDVSRPLRHNGQPYSGINVLSLWLEAMDKGYTSPFWMTYKQAIELGGYVRKGEKGTHVCYANVIERTEQNEDGEETTRKIPFMRSYTVFNADQIENLPESFRVKFEGKTTAERIQRAEEFFAATGAEIETGGTRACYYPSLDKISMPEIERFESSEAYYGVLSHETIHWTGSRTGRKLANTKDTKEYAFEELVAEIGAAFLCADLGIKPVDDYENTKNYLGFWLSILKADKRAIFNAASKANQAVAYLQSLQPAKAEEVVEEGAGQLV